MWIIKHWKLIGVGILVAALLVAVGLYLRETSRSRELQAEIDKGNADQEMTRIRTEYIPAKLDEYKPDEKARMGSILWGEK